MKAKVDNISINSFEVTEYDFNPLINVYVLRYTYNENKHQINFATDEELDLNYFKEQIKEYHSN